MSDKYLGDIPIEEMSEYLNHHGILGMRWGRKNGPPYPLGSEDHSKSEKSAGWKKSLGNGRNEELYDRKKTKSEVKKFSKKDYKKAGADFDGDSNPTKKEKGAIGKKIDAHYEKAYEKYRKAGLNEKEARLLVDKRKKTDAVIAAAAGLTLAALAGAAIYNYKTNPVHNDIILKSGAKMHTLTKFKERTDDGTYFYAAYKNGDKNMYRAFWGRERNMFGEIKGSNKFDVVNKITKNTRVASHDSGKKTFEFLMRNDKEFADEVKKQFGNSPKDLYLAFNTGMTYRDKDGHINPIYKKYIKTLKDLGYGGIIDSNDAKGTGGTGFGVKAPIILFDNQAFVKEMTTKLKDVDIDKAKNNYKNKQMMKRVGAQFGWEIPFIAAGLYGGTFVNSKAIKKTNEQKRKKEEKLKNKEKVS